MLTTFQQNTTSVLTSTSTLDGLGRLHRIESVATSGGVTLQRTTYGYDAQHRRTLATEADNRKWVYGYNTRNEVISGTKQLADNTPVLGHSYSYEFDAIGNRKKTTVNSREANYTTGDVNRIVTREVPAAVDVLGTSPASLVRVNEGAPTRQGEEFYRAVPVDQSSVPPNQGGQWVDIKSKAYLPGTGGQPDRMKSDDGKVYLPKSPQAFSYDAYGNLTGDGRWIYRWDGEHRLIEARDTLADPNAYYTYGYDHKFRRIWKKKTVQGAVEEFRRFYYDGWNLIAETLVDPSSNTSTPVAKYTWGLDLSGTPTGAGGVGGLLFTELKDGNGTWHTTVPLYDGNGNVRTLADAGTAANKAEYSFGPFGELIHANGVLAPFNPMRWSTKYGDEETGLVYYGYRYYAPQIGRWISRDPIEENGGLNTYAFVENASSSRIDLLGLCGGWTLFTKLKAATDDFFYHIDPDAAVLSAVPDSGDWYNDVWALFEAWNYGRLPAEYTFREDSSITRDLANSSYIGERRDEVKKVFEAKMCKETGRVSGTNTFNRPWNSPFILASNLNWSEQFVGTYSGRVRYSGNISAGNRVDGVRHSPTSYAIVKLEFKLENLTSMQSWKRHWSWFGHKIRNRPHGVPGGKRDFKQIYTWSETIRMLRMCCWCGARSFK